MRIFSGSYNQPYSSYAPSAYSLSWLLFSAETATPLPYFKSIIVKVSAFVITVSAVPKPSGTYFEKSTRVSVNSFVAASVLLIA